MRLRIPALAGLAFAAVLLAPAAQAAHDPEWQGWFFQLDGALVQPGNVDTALLEVGPNVPVGALGPGAESDVEWMEWDDDIAFRASIGYSFGEAGGIRVSYWTYDDTAETEGEDYNFYGGAWFTVGPVTNVYTSYIAVPGTVAFGFEQTIEAETWDIEYTKTRQVGNSLGLTFGVGVRIAEFRDTLEGQYALPDVDPNFVFPASRSIDSDGFGITGSVGVEYDFSDMFGLSSNLRLGFLTTDSEMEHTLIDAGDYTGYAYFPEFTESETIEDQISTTIDFDFNFTFHTGSIFDIEIGYLYSTWQGLPEFNLTRTWIPIGSPLLAAPPSIAGEERDRMGWGGPQLKLRIHI